MTGPCYLTPCDGTTATRNKGTTKVVVVVPLTFLIVVVLLCPNVQCTNQNINSSLITQVNDKNDLLNNLNTYTNLKYFNQSNSTKTPSRDNIDRILLKKIGQFAKRTMWMTHNKKFVLPTGTLLTVAPSITIPVFRKGQKPFKGGLNSDIKASWYFYMDFEKMGMTSDGHPWPLDFNKPPFYPFGKLMRIKLNDDSKKKPSKKRPMPVLGPMAPPHIYHHSYFPRVKYHLRRMDLQEEGRGFEERSKLPSLSPVNMRSRSKRSILSLPPPESIHGGERALLIPMLENLMENFGFEDGRNCLLRAVCEIHEDPLHNGYGLFGEIFTLLFSISRSQYAKSHMPDYLTAEESGVTGDCSRYTEGCKKSIFYWEPKSNRTNEL